MALVALRSLLTAFCKINNDKIVGILFIESKIESERN